MADPTLYLFDGYNVLHAGGYSDVRELADALASFVAVHGARGIVVFDGDGGDHRLGPLEVRYAQHADAVLERLASENRAHERICLVSSDATVRRTSGQEVTKVSSKTFVRDLDSVRHQETTRSPVADRLDDATRGRLEQLRRGRG